MADEKPIKQFTIEEKLKVEYCIPLWLRDEQIKLALKRVPARICGPMEKSTRGDEPIAVVCFGPSLNDTWERVRDFKYIVTCSGSHKFLVSRGIIPTWHIEVDPRAHKVALIGPPHPNVEYLIASTCHQAVFDHLDGMNVKLWHVFDSQADAQRTLPHGEWAITGGASVGLRALTIARHLGFTNIHVFGMDGSEGASGKHAAEHPSQPKGYAEVNYKGVTYRTTASMLACAKQTYHELDQLHDCDVKFYGDGLVAAMAKDYVRTPVDVERTFLATAKAPLITDDYRALNAQLHRENLAYGVGGGKYADTVLKLADQLKSRSVLDYGCGKGYLAKALPFPIWEYDPAIPGKEESPRPAEVVVATDVLEHIEPEKLDFVLKDLSRCTLKVGYFVIHTGPAAKTLPDGRNTHLIQRGEQFWAKRLKRYFTVGKITKIGAALHVVVGPRAAQRRAAA